MEMGVACMTNGGRPNCTRVPFFSVYTPFDWPDWYACSLSVVPACDVRVDGLPDGPTAAATFSLPITSLYTATFVIPLSETPSAAVDLV